MGRRPKNRRWRNRCHMCKWEKLQALPTRKERQAALAQREQVRDLAFMRDGCCQ